MNNPLTAVSGGQNCFAFELFLAGGAILYFCQIQIDYSFN